MQRAQGILDDGRDQCLEHGYLQFASAFDALFKGDISDKELRTGSLSQRMQDEATR